MRSFCNKFFWFIILSIHCSPRHRSEFHYSLAQKLLKEENYQAAVIELEQIFAEEPKKEIALQALFEAAVIDDLYLFRYDRAIEKLKLFTQFYGDSQKNWEAQLKIGEILFFKKQNYSQAIQHYQSLLVLNPKKSEKLEFYFRIGKSYFFNLQFKEAIQYFEKIILISPQSFWAQKAFFEIGNSYLAQKSGQFELAKKTFEQLIQRYPDSDLIAEARFGIATCLEEMDLLTEAHDAFLELLKEGHLEKQLVQLKIKRIEQRLANKKDFKLMSQELNH